MTALARAAGVDPTTRAKPFVDGSARRETIDRVTGELLRVVDLPAAERQAVAATRARARARGAGPLGAITSRIYRWSGRQARVADPAAFLGRWRERGSLAPALEVLRDAVDVAAQGCAAGHPRDARHERRAGGARRRTSAGPSTGRSPRAASTVPSSRIWTVIGLLQTLATLALVFAAVWVVLWVFVKFPVDSVTVPVLGQLPIPFVVLVAALLAGYLIARLLGLHAGWVGRRWARSLGREVRTSVAREVETSAFAGLDRLETARRALWNAARGAGEDCATRAKLSRWRGRPAISVASPGSRTLTSTSARRRRAPPRTVPPARGAAAARCARSRPGRTCPSGSGSRRSPRRATAARAALAGPRRSGPGWGPQRPTGSRATSTRPARSAIDEKNRVSPAK